MSGFAGKTGRRIRFFPAKKFSPYTDGAGKKKFSRIGPAVPELLSYIQTDRHTDKNPYYFVVWIEIDLEKNIYWNFQLKSKYSLLFNIHTWFS